jgi:hypothetical protein
MTEMEDDLLDASGRPLNLREPAATAARLLRKAHPSVVFTSGRRDLRAQARAMAQNVSKAGRDWIAKTYKPSAARAALIAWLESHPHIRYWGPMAQGFVGVLMKLPPDEVAKISRHLGGLAFDVSPVSGATGVAIRKTILTLPHLRTFLDHEGGLVRWHLDFETLPKGAPA